MWEMFATIVSQVGVTSLTTEKGRKLFVAHVLLKLYFLKLNNRLIE